MSRLSLADIGLSAPTPESEPTPARSAAKGSNKGRAGSAPGDWRSVAAAVVPGSMGAQVLYQVLSGAPAVVVDAPPGSGKTTTLLEVVALVSAYAPDIGMNVVCPTRRGAYDVAERLVARFAAFPADQRPAVAFTVSDMEAPAGAMVPPKKKKDDDAAATFDGRVVAIGTTAGILAESACDLMIFDEAYQSTWDRFVTCAANATQVLLVGDPGQIGPVVRQETSAWERMGEGPHERVPEVLLRRKSTAALHLGDTYRVGPQTVAAIAPLYEFPFASKRPERWLSKDIDPAAPDGAGLRLPELGHAVLPSEVIRESVVRGPDSPRLAEFLADAAISLLGTTYADPSGVLIRDPLNGDAPRTLRQRDVAIVVAHNATLTAVRAVLEHRGAPNIVVGTADGLQGGQWPAVVALDPLVGKKNIGEHQMSLGRLCVMASRHMASLLWVHDGSGIARFTRLAEAAAAAETIEGATIARTSRTHVTVRRHLTRIDGSAFVSRGLFAPIEDTEDEQDSDSGSHMDEDL